MSANPVRSCREKHRYPTRETANAAAVLCFEKRGVSLRVYACDDGCGGFHLTKVDAPVIGVHHRPPVLGRRARAELDKQRKRRSR